MWPLIAWAIVPGALIAAFAARGATLGWPVNAHRLGYLYLGALLALATWYVLVRRMEIPGAKLPATSTALTLLGIVVFIALNGVLLRTLHHYAGMPFRFNAVMSSTLVQASSSLF